MNLSKLYVRGRATVEKLMAGGGLRAKTMRGGLFLTGGSVAEQGSRFARNMILTRLLAPSAFGTMAIVMSTSALVVCMTEIGQRYAVIQNPRGGEDEYLNAGWWMGMGRSLLTYGIIFAMAPFVAHFYGNGELSALLRVTLLSMVFDGAMSPRSILPQKEMKFGRWMAISNGGAICGVILTVVLSFVLRDVWALAIGSCSENVFRCLLSYIVCPGLPRLGWDRGAIRDLYVFTKQGLGLSFLNLIFTRTDIFVLAKLYSATALGVYTMAVYLVQTPSVFLTNTLVQTLLPTFAHVQEDKDRVNRILIEVTSWMILLGLPATVGCYLCGSSLLRLIYGTRYEAAAGPLAVAAVVVFLSLLNVVITSVFAGMGRPGLHRRAVTASAVIMMIAIYPACKLFGVVGGQVASLLAIVGSYALQIRRMRGLTGLNLIRYGRSFVPAVLASAGALGIGLGARFIGLANRPSANIAIGATVCVIAYGVCVPAFLKIRQTAQAAVSPPMSESSTTE
ncbi:MAG TPA: oligosaccharide flippase family protein [Candidatus Binatus sp.]|nr:oligosaccharide flippase family protein [Candidatus Binatus sp.]